MTIAYNRLALFLQKTFMSQLKAWVQAARLRTLPLSIAGIVTAAALALGSADFDPWIFVGSLFTAMGFQVLSNFANDYGDGIKGTDNAQRVGPTRALQSGALTASGLKKGMIVTAILTLIMAIALIYRAFGLENLPTALLFLALGIISIIAAVKYTVGDSAYGYRGLGDLFVFAFFGLLSVVGGYFLYAKTIPALVWLPALSVGFWSTAVLHLNNMRDRESDAKVNKNTLAVLLGKKNSIVYHSLLVLSGVVAAVIFALQESVAGNWNLLPMAAAVILLGHLVRVFKTKDHKKLDPQLKVVALSTFLFSLLLMAAQLLA